MTTQENVYHFTRVAGTITAGIFTGLTLSPLLLTAPPLLSASLIPHSSRVEQLSLSDKALARAAWPVAGLAGVFFTAACWVRPGEVVLKTAGALGGKGRGGGVGIDIVSDRLRQVTPLTLLLPPLLILPLPVLAYFLSRQVSRALSTSNLPLGGKKPAPSIAAQSVENSTFAGEQFEKDVWGWATLWAVAGGVALVAAGISGAGLVGWGI